MAESCTSYLLHICIESTLHCHVLSPSPEQKKDEEDDRLEVPANWKEPEFTPKDNPHGLVDQSSFSTIFPKYQEKYLRECWPLVKNKLKSYVSETL